MVRLYGPEIVHALGDDNATADELSIILDRVRDAVWPTDGAPALAPEAAAK
jgi:hypothetical protein